MVIDDPIAVCTYFAALSVALAAVGAAAARFLQTEPGMRLKERLGFDDEPEWSDRCSR